MLIRRVFNTPNWGFRSPFDEFDRLQRQVDLLGNRLLGRGLERGAGVFPLVNLSEDSNNYYVRAELPGVKADDIDIQATGNTVSLKGERKIPIENGGAKYHRREREAGSFSRMAWVISMTACLVTVPNTVWASSRSISWAVDASWSNNEMASRIAPVA